MKLNDLFKGKSYKDVTLKPFSYITPSLHTSLSVSLAFLCLQLILLSLTASYKALCVVLFASLASFCAEFLFNLIKKQSNVSLLTAFVQGILIGMLLPENYPLIAVFFITFCSLLLCKYAFGGFAYSWANPVAVTVAVTFFLNTDFFPANPLSIENLQSRNVSLFLIQSGEVPIFPFDANVTSFFNKHIFSHFGVSVPEGYVSLFLDSGSSIPAFRFNALTLISSAFLIAFNMLDVLIPCIFLLVYAFLVRFISPSFVGGVQFQGDVILALLTSGTLFSSIYILQWFGTTPLTFAGKCVYAVFAGLSAFLILGVGLSSVGYVFMILILNVISALIQVYESRQTKNKIERILIPTLQSMKELENG